MTQSDHRLAPERFISSARGEAPTLMLVSDRSSVAAAARAAERSGSASEAEPAPERTIVIPTPNERGNVAPLLTLLDGALSGISSEVIFVDDDSRDGTADLICAIGKFDRRVRSLLRIGRRGLFSACIEGALASVTPCIAVMEADLQHDGTLLACMLECWRGGDCDLGSRCVPGGGLGDLSSGRIHISGMAARLTHRLYRSALADPVSGFFMPRRGLLEDAVGGHRARD